MMLCVPSGVPSAPQELTIVKVDKDSVTLEWKAPEKDGGSKLTGFIVSKMEAKAADWVKVATLKPQEMVYKVKDLQEKKFYFSVAAENAAGVGPAAETSKSVKPEFPSGPPSTPVGPLTASDIDGTELTLSWQPPEHDGGSPLTGYFIEKREGTKQFWGKVARIPADTETYRVPDLVEGTDYLFRVSAENKEGTSKPLEMTDTVKPKSTSTKKLGMLPFLFLFNLKKNYTQ